MGSKKLLVVDDEIEHIEVIIDVFRATDQYRIMHAMDGFKAYEIAFKELPDLIISDWDMPVISGIKFIENLRLTKETADIPVIICTGAMMSPDDLKTALEAGATDYIRKPIEPTELIARTQSILKITEYQKKAIQYQKDIIDQKNNELVENSMYLVQSNEYFKQLFTQIEDIIKEADNATATVKSLKAILNDLDFKVKEDSWNRFHLYFERVHEKFYKNLSIEFPNLSTSELRLCTFLRQGMETKDISSITLQSSDGIKMARSRLRKKFDLKKDQSLTTFLSRY